MSSIIANRYEFLCLFDCVDGNPNGDPDAGNMPRVDPETLYGLVSDVAIKRRIRNYVQLAKGNVMPNAIFIENATNLNAKIVQAHEETGNPKPAEKGATKAQVRAAADWMCHNFYDVRAFGAVMSTGPNAGQVRGPVQIAFSRSIDPVLPLDCSITRMAIADDLKSAKSSEDYQKDLEGRSEDKLRTMGRKSLIPYGLYACRGFISAFLAQKSGFNEDDLTLLWAALGNMFEHDRSSSKGMMTTQKLIVFKHLGTDSNMDQRRQQAMLGCAPAQTLFNLVKIKKNLSDVPPRAFTDYTVTIDEGKKCPDGIEVIEMI
ncbi:MAG: type I-C CRISPR-associated protein Cas7/Csd2 [Thermoguttaceae bacterium]|nr:type I-C CRISPR-associated protein Cas7/Csd2 [Thermoguttaceae bacterium]